MKLELKPEIHRVGAEFFKLVQHFDWKSLLESFKSWPKVCHQCQFVAGGGEVEHLGLDDDDAEPDGSAEVGDHVVHADCPPGPDTNEKGR